MPSLLVAARHRHSPASQVLLMPLFNILVWMRVALLVHALVVNLLRYDQVAHKGTLVAMMLVMAAETALASYAYARPTGRTLRFAVVDLLVSVMFVGASAWVLGPAYVPDYLSVTGYWAVGAPLVLAIGHNVWLGTAAGLLLGAVKVASHPSLDPNAWSAVVLYGLISLGFGLLVEFLIASMSERDRAFAATAALAERERLNRIVHDGVLQVLALMEREGPGLGPRGERLARVAREQESRLRALLSDRDVDLDGDQSRRDLIAVLDRHASSTVTVSTMADQLVVSEDLAQELDGVVSEILTNVTKHAGPAAQAWVLLEQEGRELIVSIRDNGVGTTGERLTAAGVEGHVGVKDSIRGRMRDLGGQALVRAEPGRGVEWELRIPVE